MIAKNTKIKIGRNDPCWCNSGKKYKNCHLNRQQEEPAAEGFLRHRLQKEFSWNKCLHPLASENTCGKIIKAHTLQRGSVLKKIVNKSNHVCSFYPLQRDESDFPILNTKIGWKRASTFTGFCDKHDNQTFAEIEKKEYCGSKMQNFLVGYRALCHEHYQKISSLNSHEFLSEYLDKGFKFDEQVVVQEFLSVMNAGVRKGLQDLKRCKKIYEKALLTGDITNFRSCSIFFDGNLSIASTGMVSPDFDFLGNRIQNLSNPESTIDNMFFGILSTQSGGAIVFSWPSNFVICDKFVNSLIGLDFKRIPNLIVEFMFGYIENTYFAESWWKSLNKRKQLRIKRLAGTPFFYGRFLNYSSFKYVDWKVKDIIY